MKKRTLFLLLIIPLLSVYAFSQQRGFKVVRTPQGKEITLYKGSYALIVGNGKYTAGWDELLGALNDAEGIANVLQRNGFNVTLVKDVDKKTFLMELSNFTYKYGQDEDNQLLFYYAGHGHTTTLASGEELGMLVMVDAPLPEKNPQEFDSKSVDMKSIITWSLKMKSKHVLFIFDSCFSGTVLNLRDRVMPKAISDAVRYPVRQFITAGRAHEPVPDRSVFKQLLIDILEGRIEEPIPDGYITGEELGLFLKNRVPEYNKFQHPQYGKIRDPNLDKGDFIFVLDKSVLRVEQETKLPSKPPQVQELDLSKVTKKADERAGLEREWDEWQGKMRSGFSEVEKVEKNPNVTPDEKKSVWEAFLNIFSADNPYGSEDEALRKKAQERLNFWESYKPPAKKKDLSKLRIESQVSKEGEIVPISEVDVPPRIVKSPPPEYHHRLLKSFFVKVSLNILITEQGDVDDVKIVGGFLLHKDVKAAVLKAVKEWKFKPAIKDGKKVKVWKTITIKLEGKREPKQSRWITWSF